MLPTSPGPVERATMRAGAGR